MAVQDEDAEDEDALAGGEDEVESQHDLVGPSVDLERLRGRQPPDSEGEVSNHGADQEQEEDGVTEDLVESFTSTTTVAQLAARLAGGSQLQQGLIPPPGMK